MTTRQIKRIDYSIHRVEETGEETLIGNYSRAGTPITRINASNPVPVPLDEFAIPGMTVAPLVDGVDIIKSRIRHEHMVVIDVGHIARANGSDWTIASMVWAHDALPTHDDNAVLVRVSDGKEYPVQGVERQALGSVMSWCGRTVGIALPFGSDIEAGQAVRIECRP